MSAVWALCANGDLRTGPAQCELSDQEVTAPRAPRLTSAAIRGRAVAVATGRPGSGKGLGRTSVSATAGQAQDQGDLAGRPCIKPGPGGQGTGFCAGRRQQMPRPDSPAQA